MYSYVEILKHYTSTIPTLSYFAKYNISINKLTVFWLFCWNLPSSSRAFARLSFLVCLCFSLSLFTFPRQISRIEILRLYWIFKFTIKRNTEVMIFRYLVKPTSCCSVSVFSISRVLPLILCLPCTFFRKILW